MRCELSLFAAGVACFAPLASAWGPGGTWGSNTPTFTTPGWGTPSASPTWGTAVSSGWGAHNTSGPWPTGTTAVVSQKTWHSAPVPTTSTSSWQTPEATSTGGAAAMATSFAGLVVAGGIAVLALFAHELLRYSRLRISQARLGSAVAKSGYERHSRTEKLLIDFREVDAVE